MMAKRVVVEHKIKSDTVYRFPESACLACLTDIGQIILVRQFRSVHAIETIELPGGKVMDGEAPAEAAAREFMEETGLEASKPKHLFTLDMDLSVSIHKTHIFVARATIPPHLSSSVVLTSMEEALAKINSGAITHAPTVAAIERLACNKRSFTNP
ncbi:hypothetical protein CKO11_07015 [Rhodobacter sp. TJ_12]|uniref:NUDIX hydrolase n=1 Tax=Rhodobacter sp. TJ_12 TaxID=2029399 RepID=UPI001CBFB9A6|nr:NUDIX hydrolase [Rhodobacter sp. TJ_12]MBZ4022206.1 hypothetical protein [Rhodobacter sp. TJ_12]